MPRDLGPPKGRDKYVSVATPHKSPMKVPLNDDRREKANRMQSRQALHEVQMNQIRAAATPMRKRRSFLGTSPRTPGDDGPSVGGNAVTPMKRVPILANFEEWMKMATDNKINAQNSWNFALIDYFHDMSLLREGDGVNFQRASCTLDGCVKIYTSRVDSVATETGKLLSGLAESRSKDSKGRGTDGEDADGSDGSDEEGERKKSRKKTQRSSEATLVNSFAQLQLKKMELEFSVDPLFKKASADFDEGGAKGLLLNHLGIDTEGRIVFDSSDDVRETEPQNEAGMVSDAEAENLPGEDGDTLMQDADAEQLEEPVEEPAVEVDIAGLGAKFFPNLAILDEQDICPSFKDFSLGDPNGSLSLPILKGADDWKQQKRDTTPGASGGFLDGDNPMGFDDDDDDALGFDLPGDVGFGEGGEAWAREAALDVQMRPHDGLADDDEANGNVGTFEVGKPQYGVILQHGVDDQQANILNYFDEALQKNWAGPEHWRIRRIKDAAKAANAGPTKRKEREPFEIDFAAPMSQAMADGLYTTAASISSITLPKAQWKSKSRNLLPDDKHFSSRQLLRLFLKPKAEMGSLRPSGGRLTADQASSNANLDEEFWARKNEEAAAASAEEMAARGDYDADFFQDDGLGAVGMDDDDDGLEFADARDHFSPDIAEGVGNGIAPLGEALNGHQEGAFGTQLVTQSRRLRPEYVQYARVAKKVDVRRLKEEMWRGIGFEEALAPTENPSRPTQKPLATAQEDTLMFTDVINNLQTVYPKQAMADISTSYCFICLLHLANEKGLIINNEENFEDLSIRRDFAADISDG
ncbi:barren [Eremomyces bilateralis CBS 781.70]|uniref:Condensin complex subunit 2 n=1 Tax=Eremomyces bilateralis CBS 781.70 TaxID=1392243 RepID=A0A6G1GC40_9PEZI|nr:barren [Eremomyces bilateralis CBS 781.70]KAF1815409.1 barren [Eremomyces bilateralis CBS 781.70]